MQDYAKKLLSAINQYDPDNSESVNRLRDLVCQRLHGLCV